MRLLFLVAILIGTASAAGVRERYVIPAHNEVGVYQNRVRHLNENALYRVGPDDRLVVVEEDGPHLRVKDGQARMGWVEKRLVVAVAASARHSFTDAAVLGYLENPEPIYILDARDPGETPLRLDRSFHDELRVNVDRESMERCAR